MMTYLLSNFCCPHHCQCGSWGTTGTRQRSIQENTQCSTAADITSGNSRIVCKIVSGFPSESERQHQGWKGWVWC